MYNIRGIMKNLLILQFAVNILILYIIVPGNQFVTSIIMMSVLYIITFSIFYLRKYEKTNAKD